MKVRTDAVKSFLISVACGAMSIAVATAIPSVAGAETPGGGIAACSAPFVTCSVCDNGAAAGTCPMAFMDTSLGVCPPGPPPGIRHPEEQVRGS